MFITHFLNELTQNEIIPSLKKLVASFKIIVYITKLDPDRLFVGC